MKGMPSLIALIALLVLIVSVGSAAVSPPVTIELLNLSGEGLLKLAVDESYTFDIEVTASEPFILAMVLGDQYYPGQGVFLHGIDAARRTTSALLHLTITGKESTDSLPDGVAPVAIVAGVRYQGGIVYSERFDFNVLVEPWRGPRD
jgi:hypothetical protein